MEFWTVPPMWTGRTVAVLASGRSLTREVAQSVCHLPRIVVNDTYRRAPDAEIIYASDRTWWERNAEALAMPGLKVTVQGPDKPFPGVLVLRSTGKRGFDPDPSALRNQGNSGGAALHMAVHTGAARILLFGFDMRGAHWHNDRVHAPQTFTRWISAMGELAAALRGRVEVLNCSGPGSALHCFPHARAADVLERLAA